MLCWAVLFCVLCCAVQLNMAALEVTRLHGLPVIDLGGMVFGLEPQQYLVDQHHPNKVCHGTAVGCVQYRPSGAPECSLHIIRYYALLVLAASILMLLHMASCMMHCTASTVAVESFRTIHCC